MSEVIGRTAALSVLIALCFTVGWLVGADDVLAECRSSGETTFIGKTLSCVEAKP